MPFYGRAAPDGLVFLWSCFPGFRSGGFVLWLIKFIMKKSILFVDDDPLLLEVYPLMLDEMADRWEVSGAEGGEKALEILSRRKFDVVVSDMRMPRMSGIQLMNEIRRLHPQSSRIIISGIGDQEEIARSLETTHQFLSKPVKASDLVATLSRIGKLDSLLLDEKLKTLAGRLNSLPSFPSVYFRITKELNEENPSLENIADLTLQDPALTAKMLQVANSAAFGLPDKVTNPLDAVQFIGLNAVRSIALSAHVFRDFENLDVRGFSALQVWNEAVLSARIVRHIMRLQQQDSSETEDACTAALLRNVGILMLAKNLPKEFENMVHLAESGDLSLAEASRQVFGACHASAAAYLFGLWGLSAPMVEAVALHLQPGESENRSFSPLTAVHLGHVFGQELARGKQTGKPLKPDMDYLREVGVADHLDSWLEQIRGNLATER